MATNDNDKKDWDAVAGVQDEQSASDGETEHAPAEEEGLTYDGITDDEKLVFDSSEAEMNTDNTALNHPDHIALQAKLAEVEQELHQQKDSSLRIMADAENIKQRSARDVEKARKFGLQKFVEDLLSVLDSLDQAIQMTEQAAGEESTSHLEGMKLTQKMLLDAMVKHGVQVVEPQGENFDPNMHEAIKMEQTDEHPPGTVIAVFQKGYQLHDRVVRPARVVVAKAP